MAKDDSASPKLKLNSTAWVGVFAFTCFTAFGLYLVLQAGSIDLSTAGSLGDFLGGMLNPIFALLGIFLLAMTLHQNNIALELTRIELKKSAEQMEISAEALNKQEQHMRLESLERTVVFICNEIEEEYNSKPEPLRWQGTIMSRESSLLDYAKATVSAATVSKQIPKAHEELHEFSVRFIRTLMLFVMLKRTIELSDQSIKTHLLMVVSCKLDMEFVCVAYTEVHNLSQSHCELFPNEELQQVMALLDEISNLNSLKASTSAVFLNLSV
ncbi:hypothetical protein [Rheinheimera aquimaris]|uniref:hypothetical protein n=1 Tax=Rheinheimera aquimaris TaxID=412437 RepID=UPI001E3FDF76|nr:hypothetical protein [Rheinheimera aquimaris]MCD1597882.1 hypothetical protein [Rheinheimera aquimaris]